MDGDMTKDQLLKSIAGSVAGILIGWTGSALTLAGRVTAIEASLTRIEQRLDAQAHREAASAANR